MKDMDACQSTTLSPSGKEAGDEVTRCSQCNTTVKKKNLKKHIKKIHQSPSAQDGKVKAIPKDWWIAEHRGDAPPPGKIRVKKKYYKCWQCGKLLTKASTASHLVNKHGVRPKDPKTAYFWYFDEVEKVQYRDKKAKPSSEKKVKETDPRQKLDAELSRLSTTKGFNGKPAIIGCPFCQARLNAKNIHKHVKKAHKENAQTLVSKLPKHKPQKPEKEKQKRPIEIKPDYEYSEDIFDRAKVYNGGAYGLGKSRKH